MTPRWWREDRSHWTRTGIVVASILSVTGLALSALLAWVPQRSPAAPVSDDNPLPVRVIAPEPEGSPQPRPDEPTEPTGGWGPDRPTFTFAVPPRYPVFNSITDNPAHGDERNFVQCSDLTLDGEFGEELVLRDEHIYEVYIYFANDIANSLDDGNEAAAVQMATVRATLPSESMEDPAIQGQLRGDNVPTVWDSCRFYHARPGQLIYEYGSARMYTWGTPEDGLPLPELEANGAITSGIVTADGAPLGYSSADGIVRASPEYAGFVKFRVRAVID